MLRRQTVVTAALMLGLGVFIGWQWGAWTPGGAAQADPLDREQVRALYAELDADTGPLVASGRQLAKVATLTTPSVVHIQSVRYVGNRTLEETGSGVLVTSARHNGVYVVSNRHVVRGARQDDVDIHLYDGREIHPTQIWTDKATDVAVMRVNAPGLQPALWGDSDDLEIGHMVLAMGSPFGLSQSVTLGIVSAKGRRSLRLGTDSDVLNQDFIQTDAAINPGNSGGPLIDMHGRVIGINTAIASNSGGNDGIGFSIPSNLVRKVVNALLSNGEFRRAYLGVKLDPDFNAATAARLKLDRPRGARVVEVYADTPADRAKLEIDDVILKFDGKDVEDENHLINLVSLTDVNRVVSLEVLRGGRTVTLRVQLGDRADLERRSQQVEPSRYSVPAYPMGLSVTQLDDGLALQCGLGRAARGLLVTHVPLSSPLRDVLKLYDVIVAVDRETVRTAVELQQALDRHEVDAPLVVEILRDGEPQLVINPRVEQSSPARCSP